MKQTINYDSIRFFPEKGYIERCIKDNDNLQEIELSNDEIKAINLKDIEGYSSKKCSKKMGITLKDFESLIDEARKKIAVALVDGKNIKITIKENEPKEDEDLANKKVCKFRCATCGYIYYVNYEYQDIVCPKCKSTKVMSSEEAGFSKKWSIKK